MILLIGNYPPDRQQSMQRFATMMLDGLSAAGIAARLIHPKPFLGRLRFAGAFVAKWFAYLDKFWFFRRQLARRLSESPAVVHICDHSNAMYAKAIGGAVPVVVTCHDLLAVRGALGEQTDCPASATGKLLQRWIIQGLESASAVACDSQATLRDAERLVRRRAERPLLDQITLGLSYPYRVLPSDEIQARLAEFPRLRGAPFVLHVGSNLRRKNREGVLRIFARCRAQWSGRLVFAGDALSSELHSLSRQLGVSDRIVEVPNADNKVFEALYNRATALLFPSTFEGFGWPIAEAHACGCPVLCVDREPMTEVAGEAALAHPVDDEAAFADDLMRLTDPAERQRWSLKALENAKRFSSTRMISEYIALYRRLGAAA
jgi:glycosyltransferase involved in cell wall biosynthesis